MSDRMDKGKALEKEFTDHLERTGWTVISAGQPDLIAVRGSDIRFFECKAGDGNMRPCQVRAVKVLRDAGFYAEVIREREVRLFASDGLLPGPRYPQQELLADKRIYFQATGSSMRVGE